MNYFTSQPSLLAKIHHDKRDHHNATEDPWHFLAHPEQIVGFFPENKAGRGNGITVYDVEGQGFWLPATMNTMLNRLADHYLVNLSSIKKRLQLRLGMVYYLPLPFTPELVLIQVKTRHSAPENEGVHGYVNAFKVKSSRVSGGLDEKKGNRESKRYGVSKGSKTDEILGVAERVVGYGGEQGWDGQPYLEMECGLRFPCLTSQKKVNARFLQAQVAMDEIVGIESSRIGKDRLVLQDGQ